ncbi:Uma2 family endonuclease [Spirulina major CS-329]|uniref:Uma2 family endonuclease n=1 Tax=Spirulina TaxID=1154 RepID=UPI00232C2D34|nr:MULTISPECIES: Uma2 family endonuclease [Spirulina]MDB9496175.1 Uma2 family endonuclease [Spirulina subsalsa CS-330]MDB9501607.1 Uma2 family endonuclease [Spirulina major CS-329]
MVQVPPKPLSLQLPDQLALCVTPEQFAALVTANRELCLERTATGELIVNPPTGGNTGYRNSKINYFLVRWIEEEGGNGRAFDSSTGFELPNGSNRSPDAAWVSSERWQALTPEQQDGFIPLCPDFVVELRSKSDRLQDLRSKMAEYLENGTRLGWLLDSPHHRVEIYHPGPEVEVVENPKTVSGETVLPGFILNLNRVWG